MVKTSKIALQKFETDNNDKKDNGMTETVDKKLDKSFADDSEYYIDENYEPEIDPRLKKFLDNPAMDNVPDTTGFSGVANFANKMQYYTIDMDDFFDFVEESIGTVPWLQRERIEKKPSQIKEFHLDVRNGMTACVPVHLTWTIDQRNILQKQLEDKNLPQGTRELYEYRVGYFNKLLLEGKVLLNTDGQNRIHIWKTHYKDGSDKPIHYDEEQSVENERTWLDKDSVDGVHKPFGWSGKTMLNTPKNHGRMIRKFSKLFLILTETDNRKVIPNISSTVNSGTNISSSLTLMNQMVNPWRNQLEKISGRDDGHKTELTELFMERLYAKYTTHEVWSKVANGVLAYWAYAGLYLVPNSFNNKHAKNVGSAINFDTPSFGKYIKPLVFVDDLRMSQNGEDTLIEFRDGLAKALSFKHTPNKFNGSVRFNAIHTFKILMEECKKRSLEYSSLEHIFSDFLLFHEKHRKDTEFVKWTEENLKKGECNDTQVGLDRRFPVDENTKNDGRIERTDSYWWWCKHQSKSKWKSERIFYIRKNFILPNIENWKTKNYLRKIDENA